MSITLINATKRIKLFNLPHASYCKALGNCACTVQQGKNRRICKSLTLPAGASLDNIPEAVLDIPEVQRAVRAGVLKVQRKSKPKSKKTKSKKSKPSTGRKQKKG